MPRHLLIRSVWQWHPSRMDALHHMPQSQLRRAARVRCVLWEILRLTRDPSGLPCHRVVNCRGRLAPCFGVGGAVIQKERLEAEGVTVTRSEYEYYVDMKKYGYQFGDDL